MALSVQKVGSLHEDLFGLTLVRLDEGFLVEKEKNRLLPIKGSIF